MISEMQAQQHWHGKWCDLINLSWSHLCMPAWLCLACWSFVTQIWIKPHWQISNFQTHSSLQECTCFLNTFLEFCFLTSLSCFLTHVFFYFYLSSWLVCLSILLTLENFSSLWNLRCSEKSDFSVAFTSSISLVKRNHRRRSALSRIIIESLNWQSLSNMSCNSKINTIWSSIPT